MKEHRKVDLDPESLEKISKHIGEQIKGGLIVREEAEGVSAPGTKF